MAFENDYFKFSAPLKPTISGANTRIVVKRKSDDRGQHTYNYNRIPLSRIQEAQIDVEGPTLAHVIDKLHSLTGLQIGLRDFDPSHHSLNLEMFKPTEIEFRAHPMSHRWLGTIKLIVTYNPSSLDFLIHSPILSGFEQYHLQ